jgi:hypothetical protein
MKNLPLSNVYQLLEPGPVVLLTTAAVWTCPLLRLLCSPEEANRAR